MLILGISIVNAMTKTVRADAHREAAVGASRGQKLKKSITSEQKVPKPYGE